MKRIYTNIITLALTLLLLSCDKQLDLKPEDRLVDSEVFSNELGTEQVLADGYYNLFRASTSSVSYLIGDFTTANIRHSVYYNTADQGDLTPESEEVTAIWTNYYKTINIANNLLEKVPQFAAYSEAKQQQFSAEAKFLRAMAYLDLLKLYGDGALNDNPAGLGLPLQLSPFKGYDTGDVIPRSTNQEVYNQIIKDLEEAIPALPLNYSDDLKTRTRATKGNAYALLSRTYLYNKRYDQAATAAAEVLKLTPATYELNSSLLNVFPANPDGSSKPLAKEHLFAFPVSYIKSSATYARNNIGDSYYFKRSFWIDPDFINLHEAGDLRVSQLIFQGDAIHNPDQFNSKVSFKFNEQYGRDNVPVIRLAEVILTRAEALARTQGITAEVLGLLNQIRGRSLPLATPYTAASFANADALINAILLQRRFELAFEGHYRYDRIRTGHPPRDNNLSPSKWALPLPESEIRIGKGIIIQNPGYKS